MKSEIIEHLNLKIIKINEYVCVIICVLFKLVLFSFFFVGISIVRSDMCRYRLMFVIGGEHSYQFGECYICCMFFFFLFCFLSRSCIRVFIVLRITRNTRMSVNRDSVVLYKFPARCQIHYQLTRYRLQWRFVRRKKFKKKWNLLFCAPCLLRLSHAHKLSAVSDLKIKKQNCFVRVN